MATGRLPRAAEPARFGFTMVEMLAVIAVCGTLALIVMPFTSKARSSARTVVCSNNLRGLGQAYVTGLIESTGTMPNPYYDFQDKGGGCYRVTLRTTDKPGATKAGEAGSAMICPTDDTPRAIAAGATGIIGRNARSSYAYNVNLPLIYRNVARVPFPVHTVTFFDGDINSILGDWQHVTGWQGRAIRDRHSAFANYLYLDGHVERLEAFSEISFNWTLMPGASTPVPSSPSTVTIGGFVQIGPNNNLNSEFTLVLPDGVVVTRDNLHADTCFAPHTGFSSTGLEYTGPADCLRIRPKACGNLTGFMVNGLPYTLKANDLYSFTNSGGQMSVHVYNDKRNKSGMPTGRWCVDITGDKITITVLQ